MDSIYMCVCVCVCVCVRERERERENIYIYIYIYISPVIDFSYFGPMQLKLTSWACQTITKCEMTSTFDTTKAYWSCDCLITILSKETLYIPLKWKWRGEKDPSAIHLHTIYPGLDLMLKQESIIASNQ